MWFCSRKMWGTQYLIGTNTQTHIIQYQAYMKKLLQTLFVACAAVALMGFGYSQEKGWEQIAAEQGVTISQKVTNCEASDMPFDFLLLKVKNTARSTVQVRIVLEKIKNGEVVPTDLNDVTISLTLKRGQEVAGNCAWADENHMCHLLAENAYTKSFDELRIKEFTVIAQ